MSGSGNRPFPAQRAYGAGASAGDTLSRMHFPFLDNWRKRHGDAEGVALTDALSSDPESAAQLLSECELLREQARGAGVELDDSADSLAALDQLPPHWREDPEVSPWLGSDAGLYLGTVIVRTVPGARWVLRPDGQPVVLLPSGPGGGRAGGGRGVGGDGLAGAVPGVRGGQRGLRPRQGWRRGLRRPVSGLSP